MLGLQLLTEARLSHGALNRYKATKAVVLAAGAWSGQILAAALGNAQWQNAFSPRKGHLLEVELPNNMPALRQGLMEGSYASVRNFPPILFKYAKLSSRQSAPLLLTSSFAVIKANSV